MDMTRPVPLDIAMIAGRRPELIRRTLESFSKHLFAHFEICKVHVNLDPFMGKEGDEEICAGIIRHTLPQAQINMPKTPGFGAAVKHVWSNMGDNICFHMEDDWICLQDITPEMIASGFDDPATSMIYPAHKQRRKDQTNPRERVKKTKLFGVTVRRHKVAHWGTSPRFISGPHARRFAALLDPMKDPEKQVYTGINKALCAVQEKTRVLGVWNAQDGPLIADIGRDYREGVNLVKVNLPDGSVHWQEG